MEQNLRLLFNQKQENTKWVFYYITSALSDLLFLNFLKMIPRGYCGVLITILTSGLHTVSEKSGNKSKLPSSFIIFHTLQKCVVIWSDNHKANLLLNLNKCYQTI